MYPCGCFSTGRISQYCQIHRKPFQIDGSLIGYLVRHGQILAATQFADSLLNARLRAVSLEPIVRAIPLKMPRATSKMEFKKKIIRFFVHPADKWILRQYITELNELDY